MGQEKEDRRWETAHGRKEMEKGDRSWLTEDMIHKKDDQRQEM